MEDRPTPRPAGSLASERDPNVREPTADTASRLERLRSIEESAAQLGRYLSDVEAGGLTASELEQALAFAERLGWRQLAVALLRAHRKAADMATRAEWGATLLLKITNAVDGGLPVEELWRGADARQPSGSVAAVQEWALATRQAAAGWTIPKVGEDPEAYPDDEPEPAPPAAEQPADPPAPPPGNRVLSIEPVQISAIDLVRDAARLVGGEEARREEAK